MTVFATFYGERPRDKDGQVLDATGLTLANAQSSAAGTITLAETGLYFVSCDAAHRVRFTLGSELANTGDYWPSGTNQYKYLPGGTKIVIG